MIEMEYELIDICYKGLSLVAYFAYYMVICERYMESPHDGPTVPKDRRWFYVKKQRKWILQFPIKRIPRF